MLLKHSRRPFWAVLKRLYHKSPYKVDVPNCSLAEFMFRNIDELSKKPALVDGITGRTWSFEQLYEESHNLTANLFSIGLRSQQVACLYATNRPEFAHIIYAVAANNAALTIANSQLTPVELSQQLRETTSKILFTTPDVAEKAKQAAKLSPSIQEVVVLGEHADCRPFSSLIKKSSCGIDNGIKITPGDDVVLIPYSSGTTGLPKGVQLTHTNLIAQVCQLSHHLFLPFSDGESSLSMLPMVHIAGFSVGMLNPICQGAAVVVLPRFEPETFLQSLQKYRCTFSLLAPPVVNFLAHHPLVDKYDVSSLRTPYCGAAPLGREVTEIMVKRVGLTGIRQGYGMSEASPATHTAPLNGWKHGSIGVPLPNTESKIVDVKDGSDLGVEGTGEIWVRGPQVMKGYLNNEKATRNSLTDDGWLKTGDIGYYDCDGHYFVVDRLKEIIKYKGYQVAPAYLEDILIKHQNVSDAGVVGIPDKIAGEVPKAFVVLKKPMDKKELLQYVNDQVAPFKRLRGGIDIVEKLPRAPSGKILRRLLLEEYLKHNK